MQKSAPIRECILNHTKSGEGKQGEKVYLRHTHREAGNHTFVVERLENKPTNRRVVDSNIFVVLQIRQFMLPNVNHSLVCFARL